MVADCEDRKIDFILIKSISRFSRNTADCLELVRKLLSHGIYIYFEKENIHTGSMESELMLSILSGLAENESNSIAENNKWSIQKRFQNGTYKIASSPYGYDAVNGELIVNEQQAEIVRFIFSEILSGKSLHAIAKQLNQRNVPTKKAANGQVQPFEIWFVTRNISAMSSFKRPIAIASSKDIITTEKKISI